MRWFVATVVLLASAPALADSVDVQLFTKVAQGDKPRLKLVAGEAVSNVVVTLSRDDGKKFTFNVGRLAAGSWKEIGLDPAPGRHHYTGKLSAVQGGERQQSDLDFDAVVAPPLQIQIDKTKVDLGANKFEIRLSRPAGKVEFKVIGESGFPLADESRSFTGKEAGEPLEIEWTPRKNEPVAKIEIKAYDVDDFFTGIAVMPWSVYIPHEEVNFRTDSAEIDASEKPKLDASFGKITDALTKYKELGAIKLFIAGHTDTVGNDSYNLGLSQRRAQSIGGWFRKRGLRIPIAYEGFGESAPLVRTADNVDEPRNRRVDYILAVEEPQLKSTGFRAAWKRIN